MDYILVSYARGAFLPFVTGLCAEAALREAAARVGLDVWEIAPLAHKSRVMVLRDRAGNLVAKTQKLRVAAF